MPWFSQCCGADEYICQKCGKIFCSRCHPSQWRKDITRNLSAGNVCPSCVEKHDGPKVLEEPSTYLKIIPRKEILQIGKGAS